jgi:hypothetical protein
LFTVLEAGLGAGVFIAGLDGAGLDGAGLFITGLGAGLDGAGLEACLPAKTASGIAKPRINTAARPEYRTL